jgi:hypothetical protein
MMSIFFSYYSGILGDALISGAILGAIVGIVIFSAESTSESIHRVMFGFLLGGLLMGAYQAFLIASVTGVSIGTSFNPLLSVGADSVGKMAADAITRTVQAAIAVGLLMVISIAPVVAFKGAIVGAITGTVAGLGAWRLLEFVDTGIPLVVFYVLLIGVILFILENLPVRG